MKNINHLSAQRFLLPLRIVLSLRGNKIFLMKKTTLFLLVILLVGFAAQAQNINMRNRKAWKAPVQNEPAKQTNAAVTQPEVTEEPDTSSATRIPEVVVSATRTEQKLDEVGRSVSVISADDIKNSGANSLAELLNMSEGIYVVGSGQNPGSIQSLFMRGANSNQSVVMIDGIAITDPSTPSATLDLSELSLSEIDHVEIVRGSHSTLYGSSAIGGVINIITNKKQKEGLNIRATGTAGSFGEETSLIGQNIGMNYTWKNGLYANMNFNNSTVNGIDATIDNSQVPGMPRDMDGMTHFDFGGKAGYKTNRWDVSFSGKKTERSADIDDGEFNDDDNYTLDFERTLVAYSASCRLDSGLYLSFNGGHSSMERLALDDSSLIDNNGNYDQVFYRGKNSGETFTNELQVNFQKEHYSVVIGGGTNSQRMNQDTYTYYYDYIKSQYAESKGNLDSLDLQSKTSNFFLLAELKGTLFSQKAKAFTLGLGARNNNNNTFGSSITYQVSPRIKVSSTSTLYGNISSGYNAPSLYQLHSPDMYPPATIPIGNINLRPESSVTNEFGLYQKINDKTGLRLGFYKTVVSDAVEYVYLWDKDTPIDSLDYYTDYRGDTYLNLGKLTTEGIEVDAHSAMGKKFLISGNFTWTRGKQDFYPDQIDSVKTEGNYVQLQTNGEFLPDYKLRSYGLTRRPVTANLTVTYMPTTKVFIKAVLKYVSRRKDVYYDYTIAPGGGLATTPVRSYSLLDIVSGVKFSQNLSGLIRIENVFNETYSEIRGFSSRGRGFYMSINYTF